MRALDKLGAAIVNAMTAVPPHDCGDKNHVDCDGACVLCRRRAVYLIEHLGQGRGRR